MMKRKAQMEKNLRNDYGKALLNRTKLYKNNTRIFDEGHHFSMYLYNNCLAKLYPDGKLFITTANFNTNSTVSRLNSIDGVEVRKRNGNLYLNTKLWDGNWIEVNTKEQINEIN